MQSIEIGSLEFLEVLCERGEALLPRNGFFYTAQDLLRVGYAEVVGEWAGIADIIKPTPLGLQLNEIRKNLLARPMTVEVKVYGQERSA